LSYIYAIIAGAIMSLQGVINTRLGDKIGVLETNAFVQGTAFVLSLAVACIFGKGDFTSLFKTDWYYLTGGVLGVVITITVMLAMSNSSPAIAVSVILVSQLLVAAGIDYFGIIGTEKVPFGANKFIGLIIMIVGIIVFKFK